MNYTFTNLKKKTVIDIANGKKLGKITDITISYPNGCFESITVTPQCVGIFSQEKILITPCMIASIGEDAVLVKMVKNTQCQSQDKTDFCEEE